MNGPFQVVVKMQNGRVFSRKCKTLAAAQKHYHTMDAAADRYIKNAQGMVYPGRPK